MLSFITIDFLKDKLAELKSSDSKELLVYQLEKEIALLNKLDVEKIDMRGTPEDFENMLTEFELVFLHKGEWDKVLKERNFYKQCKELFENV